MLDADDCFGFTPLGPDLADEARIDRAVEAWREAGNGADEDDRTIALDETAEVCAVYAGPDSYDDPTVALLSADVNGASAEAAVAIAQLAEDEWRMADIAEFDEGTPLIAVGERTWLLADAVERAQRYVGSVAETASPEAVEGPLVEESGRAEERILVIAADDRTVLAAGSPDADAMAPTLLPIAGSASVVDEVLSVPGGVPLLVGALRDPASGRSKLAELELIGTVDVPDVGVVLASVTSDPLAGRGGSDVAMIHVATDNRLFFNFIFSDPIVCYY